MGMYDINARTGEAPKRSLLVAQDGGSHVNVASALAQATALVPTAANPVKISVAPGTYIEPNNVGVTGAIVIPTNVHVSGLGDPRQVVLVPQFPAASLFEMQGESSLVGVTLSNPGGARPCVYITAGSQNFVAGCIFVGWSNAIATVGVAAGHAHVKDCEFYQQTSSPINVDAASTPFRLTIESCDFACSPANANPCIALASPVMSFLMTDSNIGFRFAQGVNITGAGTYDIHDTRILDTVNGGGGIRVNSAVASGISIRATSVTFNMKGAFVFTAFASAVNVRFVGILPDVTSLTNVSLVDFKGVFVDSAGQVTSIGSMDVIGDFLTLGSVTALPGAASSNRGQIRTVQGAAGARDRTYQCVKSDSDTYSWVEIINGGP